jgi:flavin reductase (DIM6/NTAB) family NADH-FMN oxidoreductase RutF
MAIGWASFGVLWGRPVATVMVRPSRYTFGCIESTGDFTLSVPYEHMADAVSFCGTRSGRDVNKFGECRFTRLPGEGVRSPGIAECAVVYFCRVIHCNDVVPAHLDGDVAQACYPAGDYHRFYYGQIELVLADEDFA